MRQITSFFSCFTVLSVLLITALPSQAANISLNSTDEGGSGSFSGELLESSCAKTGVVMFHGRGSTPTGPVVEELRTSLNRAGYTTLSIDNPIPASGTTDFSSYEADVDNVFTETYARMRAAINHLQTLGVKDIVVAGFSLGSRFATAHVARGQVDELPILGLIGVGMYGNKIEPFNVADTLDEVSVPVIDIYGDNDASAVDTAAARLAAYNSGSGLNYTQTEFTCLLGLNCHQLEGLKGDDSMPLEVDINAWMQAVAPASVLPDCPSSDTTSDTTTSSGGGSALNIYLTLIFLLLPLLRAAKIRD